MDYTHLSDPIPSLDGSIAAGEARPLNVLQPGAIAQVPRVSDRDLERLRYLEELGSRPGTTFNVLEVLLFDGPLRLEVDGVWSE